jgi:hypothetical protein
MTRVLVVVLAETRAAELTFTNFQENVLRTLDADLAICIGVGSDYDTNNPYYQDAKYRFTYPEPADGDFAVAFDDAYRNIAQEYPDISLFPWRNYLKVKDQFMGGIHDPTDQHPGSAGILIFFRWFLWQQLNAHGLVDRYDRFIITRSDYIYQLPHPSMEVLDADHIWIPDQEQYGGYTDRHVVLTKNTLEPYLNILTQFALRPEYYYDQMICLQNYWNLERLIKFHLIQQGVGALVCEFPYIMYTVRAKDGTTRWSQGDWSESHGYYIKYKTEYQHSTMYKAAYDAMHPLPNIDFFYYEKIMACNPSQSFPPLTIATPASPHI